MTIPRTYHVRFKRDHTPNCLHWLCLTSGDGHWCTADNHPSKHQTEQAAHLWGEAWVETGLSSEQLREFIECPLVEQQKLRAA